MKRLIVIFGLAVTLLLVGSPAQAQDCTSIAGVGQVCATLVRDQIVVTVLGQTIARLDAPVVYSTVTVQVPGPKVTINIPGPIRTVPGPVRTVPGPIRTIVITRNGSTVTVRPDNTTGQTTQPRGTVSSVPSRRPNPSVASPQVKVVEKEKQVIISVPKAVGISVGFILLGILIALGLLWALYTVGYKEGEEGNKKFLRELLLDLRRRR